MARVCGNVHAWMSNLPWPSMTSTTRDRHNIDKWAECSLTSPLPPPVPVRHGRGTAAGHSASSRGSAGQVFYFGNATLVFACAWDERNCLFPASTLQWNRMLLLVFGHPCPRLLQPDGSWGLDDMQPDPQPDPQPASAVSGVLDSHVMSALMRNALIGR